jgi:hypothetical protein
MLYREIKREREASKGTASKPVSPFHPILLAPIDVRRRYYGMLARWFGSGSRSEALKTLHAICISNLYGLLLLHVLLEECSEGGVPIVESLGPLLALELY